MTICQRCGGDAVGLIMSMFNHDMICSACKQKEKKQPGYAAAEATDLRAYADKLDGHGMTGSAESVRKAADKIEKEGPQTDDR